MRPSTMSMRAERTPHGRSSRGASDPSEKKGKPNLRRVLPEIWKLVRPRRWILLLGMLLTGFKSVTGLVLPVSTKFLIDTVLKPDGSGAGKLPWLVAAVFTATALQAVTSFSLTQLLSKAGQRMIADLRKQVQAHIGSLPVSFLRREPHRHPRLAHHDRRRRCSQPYRHRPGGFCRRHSHRQSLPSAFLSASASA